jgi:hypothetical protein
MSPKKAARYTIPEKAADHVILKSRVAWPFMATIICTLLSFLCWGLLMSTFKAPSGAGIIIALFLFVIAVFACTLVYELLVQQLLHRLSPSARVRIVLTLVVPVVISLFMLLSYSPSDTSGSGLDYIMRRLFG